MISLALGVLILSFVYMCFTVWRKRNSQCIPGPVGWPLLGNINLDMKQFHKECSHLAEKYGDVFQFSFFGQTTVVVNSYEAIREVLLTKSDDFSGRPRSFRMECFTDGLSFSLQTLTPNLAAVRKATHKVMKLHGEGLQRIENIVADVCEDIVHEFKSTKGLAFDPQNGIFTAISNVMCVLLFGKKYPPGDPLIIQLQEIDKCISEIFSPKNALLDVFPILRHFGNQTYKKLQDVLQFRRNVLFPLMDEVKKSTDSERVECILGHFVQLQNDAVIGRILTDECIISNISDTLTAGTATTIFSLSAFLNILLHYPDVQSRLHEEIDHVIGRERAPQLADKPRMPYLEATIIELMRFLPVAALAIPHCTIRDTSVGEYNVKKGTQVLVNLWHLHHSKDYFSDPWTFSPTRFLTADGSVLPSDHFRRRCMLAFGAGKRVCIGENLAKPRMFIIISTLLQHFNFVADPENPPPSCDPRSFKMDLLLCQESYKLKALPRF